MAEETREQTEKAEGTEFPPVSADEVREAVFPNAVENVIFSRLLFELGSDDIAVRAKAARAMAGIHHALSVRALSAQLLREDSPQVRKECVDALAALEMKDGLQAVEHALQDKAPSVRLAAVRGIYRLAGNEGVPLLVSLFDDENELVRCRAATCAGWLGQPELADPLLQLMEDKSATVRRAAVEAMGYLSSPHAVSALIEHLDDADEVVRRKALEAVRAVTGKRMGDEDDPEALVARWREWWKENRDSFVLEPRTPVAVAHGVMSPAGESGAATGGRTPRMDANASANPAVHELERNNKELQVRVKELELQLAARQSVPEMEIDEEEFVEVSEEGTDIISIVRGLERELDAAFDLKESLESDLARTQALLENEQEARQEIESKVDLLQAQAALAEQLRDEVVFVKEERDVLSRRYDEASNRINRLNQENEDGREQLGTARKRIEELQRDRIDLEAQVFNLRDKLKEYATAVEMRQSLETQVGQLNEKLKTSETSRDEFESEVLKLREQVYTLREENESLEKGLASANSDLAELRERLQEQASENSELTESNTRLDRELNALKVKHEATTKLLDAAKKSLRDIRSAAVRTTEHFRERYYKPIDERGGGSH